MVDQLCPVCKDLDYSRFVEAVRPGLTKYRTRPKYLVIEFDDLRAASLAGCTSCNILEQGVRLFWGDNPEKSTLDDDQSESLILKRCMGMSLIAYRWPGETWEESLVDDFLDELEFFTPESKSYY